MTMGADNCMFKKISAPELSAHIRALFRRIKRERELGYAKRFFKKEACGNGSALQERSAKEPQKTARLSELLSYGDLALNNASHAAFCGDRELSLTPAEFRFLSYLLQKRTAVSKEELLSVLWGHTGGLRSHSVDDLVKRLRKKLRQAESNVLIETIRGFGFRLSINPEAVELAEEFQPCF